MQITTNDDHLLILGAGSVGRRHLRNFRDLNCRVSAMDPRPDRLEEAAREGSLVGQFRDLDRALAEGGPYAGVVICSPPSFHVSQALAAVERKLPILMEKPVSPDARSAAQLRRAAQTQNVPILLGYTYRWWPALQECRRRIQQRAIGRPLHFRAVLSAHLADWHPWERYQDFFMASRELGGGALLDESHFVDLMYWMFGAPRDVMARVERISGLEIDSDDNVDAVFSYADGLRASLHLDLYGRPHQRELTIVGEDGTLHWTFDPNRLRAGRGSAEWEDTLFTNERNDMFVGVAREFLEVVRGTATPSCTIEDGCAVLEILEAMRESASTGAQVAIRAER